MTQFQQRVTVHVRDFYYRCNGCKPTWHRPEAGIHLTSNPFVQGWVAETAPRALPEDRRWSFDGRQHYELHRNAGCQGWLRKTEHYVDRTEGRDVPLQVHEPAWGRARLAQVVSGTLSENVPVVAVMYCSDQERWFLGHARASGVRDLDRLPERVKRSILARDRDKMVEADSYGVNCAEVECVRRAYASDRDEGRSGRRQQDLSGCIFIARKRQGTHEFSACRTCRAWISELGGRWGDYVNGRFTLR